MSDILRNIPNQSLSSPLGSSPFDRALALRDRALALRVRRTSPAPATRCRATEITAQYASVFPDSGDFTEGGGAQRNTDCPTPHILFGDCFRGCTGEVSEADPGPICGWTFDTSRAGPFTGGSFVFTDGAMTCRTAGDQMFPGVVKPMPGPLVGVHGITAQFLFREYQTPPNPNTTYLLSAMNENHDEAMQIALFGDGAAVAMFGLPDLMHFYLGAWTPNGGQHIVHLTISESGVPTLYVDGVSTGLAFFGDVFSDVGVLGANMISFYGGSGANEGSPGEGDSPITGIFLVDGVYGPETVFACP